MRILHIYFDSVFEMIESTRSKKTEKGKIVTKKATATTATSIEQIALILYTQHLNRFVLQFCSVTL